MARLLPLGCAGFSSEDQPARDADRGSCKRDWGDTKRPCNSQRLSYFPHFTLLIIADTECANSNRYFDMRGADHGLSVLFRRPTAYRIYKNSQAKGKLRRNCDDAARIGRLRLPRLQLCPLLADKPCELQVCRVQKAKVYGSCCNHAMKRVPFEQVRQLREAAETVAGRRF
eukprot:6209562-Pleurochrysis_carterae.AAC.2